MIKRLKSRPIIILCTLLLTAGSLLSGCGKSAPPAQTMKPNTPKIQTPTPTPAPEKPKLSETIVLPEGFTIDQAVYVSEIEALVNDTGYYFTKQGESEGAQKGYPSGAYDKKNASGHFRISFSVFVNGKEKKYDEIKGYILEDTLKEIDSELWDKGFVGLFKTGNAAAVALKADVCIRVDWTPRAYPQFEDAEFGAKLINLVVNNLYGGERLPDSEDEEPGAAGQDSPEALADPDIPDKLPPELDSAVKLNEFATDLYLKYVKPNIFEANIFSAEDEASARKALRLIIEAEDKAIALYDKNEAFYSLRGKAYAKLYYDTRDAVYKELGLADLKKAIDMGLESARTEYDKLKSK